MMLFRQTFADKPDCLVLNRRLRDPQERYSHLMRERLCDRVLRGVALFHKKLPDSTLSAVGLPILHDILQLLLRYNAGTEQKVSQLLTRRDIVKRHIYPRWRIGKTPQRRYLIL